MRSLRLYLSTEGSYFCQGKGRHALRARGHPHPSIRRSKDLEQAHALQDAVKVEQPGGPGKFEVPNWDQASRKKIADALTVLGATLVDWRGAAGR
jgi:hypothetical protein